MISYTAKRDRLPSGDCVGLVFASEVVLGLLNDVRLERCPEELAERTIQLLCTAAAGSTGGREYRGNLSLLP